MELPQLKNIHEKYRNEGFEIVPITLSRTSREWIDNYRKKHDLDFHFLMEEEGDKVAREKFKVRLQGYVCLVDREGKIRHFFDSWLGDEAVPTYESLVKKMLEK